MGKECEKILHKVVEMTGKHEVYLTSLIPKGIEIKASMRHHFLALQITKDLTKFIQYL